MSAILPDDVKKQLSGTLESLAQNVKIIYFYDKEKCNLCEETKSLLEEISELSEKINIAEYNISENSDLAKKYGIDRVPGFTLLRDDDSPTGMKFYGPPAGYEINSFIFALLETSGQSQELPEAITEKIKNIDKKINIKVFVGLSCPHCPGAVITANKMSILNPNINTEMIEASLFGELSEQYGISSVPRIFFNDKEDLLGAQPIEEFIKVIDSL